MRAVEDVRFSTSGRALAIYRPTAEPTVIEHLVTFLYYRYAFPLLFSVVMDFPCSIIDYKGEIEPEGRRASSHVPWKWKWK